MNPRRISGLLLSVALAAACGGDDMLSPSDLAGTWTGSTGQGRAISFTVTSSGIEAATIGFIVNGSFCTIEGSTTASGPALPIEDGRFEFDISGIDPSFSGTGEFESSTSARGTLVISSGQCDGSASTTWTASR